MFIECSLWAERLTSIFTQSLHDNPVKDEIQSSEKVTTSLSLTFSPCSGHIW